jgi:hypothetical protein
LAVDGVEAAHGVAEEHPAEWVSPEALDVTTLVGGEPVGDRLVDDLPVGDEVGDDRRAKLACVIEGLVVV